GNPKTAKPNGEYRLSNLPDDVIHRILTSLRDTASAARTAVFSKRWRYLWISLPDLSFQITSFRWEFLVYVLLRRNRNRKLNSFRACIASDTDRFSDEVGLRNWVIDYVVRAGVCHLDLSHADPYERFPVPPGLLGCRTLKTLTLGDLDVTVLSSSAACFHGVTDLCLDNCAFRGHFDVSAIFPNLVKLRLLHTEVSGDDDHCGTNGFMEISTTQLVYLNMVHLLCQRVKISAPNLQVFKISDIGSVISDFFVFDLPSLRHAEVLLYDDQEADTVFKLLYWIRNVESLVLSTGTLEVSAKCNFYYSCNGCTLACVVNFCTFGF
ncbi:hypothetical protein Tsubulata_046430, partial [Turnera subulata]